MKQEFKSGDLLYNVLKARPAYNFLIYEGQIYLNSDHRPSGSHMNPILGVPNGYISLHELNVDRPSASIIYPFVAKDGVSGHYTSISTSSYGTDFKYGDTLTGSYNMSSSIAVEIHAADSTRARVDALRNILNGLRVINPAYAFSSSGGDKETQALSLISIPEIAFGDNVRKGSVRLGFYLSGSLIDELSDKYRNGDLVDARGLVGGQVLYNEGQIILTGSWDVHATHTEDYQGSGAESPKWRLWGSNIDNSVEYSAFDLRYEGEQRIPNVTMLCHAKAGKLVHSNNPTYVQYSQSLSPISSSGQYMENKNVVIRNTVPSVYNDPDADFAKQTWISKIVIYDENGTAIGIAKLAQPVRKTLARDLTFRISLDV